MKSYKIVQLIEKIIGSKPKNFTGFGLIVYSSIDSLPIEAINSSCDLIHKIIDLNEICDKLLFISNEDCECHDGFHLLNERIELTSLSYYFSTPISVKIKPVQNKGSRYRTAFYGSLLNNVLCTIMVSSNLESLIFIDGNEYNLDEYKFYCR